MMTIMIGGAMDPSKYHPARPHPNRIPLLGALARLLALGSRARARPICTWGAPNISPRQRDHLARSRRLFRHRIIRRVREGKKQSSKQAHDDGGLNRNERAFPSIFGKASACVCGRRSRMTGPSEWGDHFTHSIPTPKDPQFSSCNGSSLPSVRCCLSPNRRGAAATSCARVLFRGPAPPRLDLPLTSTMQNKNGRT